MEPIILLQHKWGLTFNIPWYLFLGGLAGGTMTCAALSDLLGGRREGFQYFARVSAYLTPPVIVAGGLFLTFHLGKPERGFAFPLFFTNYNSWMTIGGWIVGAFAPLSLAYAAAWLFDLPRRLRLAMAAPGVPLGVLMSLYTGFLLSAAWAVPGGRWFVPLWDPKYLPVLFLLSGFSTALGACGLAALIASRLPWVASGGKTADDGWVVARIASLTDMAAILMEGGWVYLFLTSMAVGSLGQRLAFDLVTRGSLAPWFWWGFVAVGLAAPLVASVVETLGERVFHVNMGWILYAKFVMVIAGGLVLRYLVVWGGDLKAPLSFPPSLWPVPGLGG